MFCLAHKDHLEFVGKASLLALYLFSLNLKLLILGTVSICKMGRRRKARRKIEKLVKSVYFLSVNLS